MPEFDKEHTEQILDKVHLAMSKKDPYWQDKVFSGNEGEINQFHKLQRLSLEQVLESSESELNWKEWEELGKGFEELKANDLSMYAMQKSEWLKGKKERLEKEKDGIEEDIQEETEKNKSGIIILIKAKKKAIGETWTQPSGRKVKKISEGVIVEVKDESEGKEEEEKPAKKTSKKPEGFKKELPKPEGTNAKFKQGAKVVHAIDKAITETGGGGFAKSSEEVPAKIKDVVKKNKGKKEKTGNQDVSDNPRELAFSDINVKEQYTSKKDYDKEQINQLKQSIKENGFDPAFPIMVDKQNGKWTVVAGHHRYEAVKSLIEENELPESFKIPVITKSFASNNDRLAAQISENQRRTVLATDEAKAYGQMKKDGWNSEKIAQKLGKTVGEVNKKLALNNLSSDLFHLVSKKDRSLPLGVAESIGMFAVNDNGQPNETIQLKAFKWFQENKSKINTPAPVAIQSYIKELKSDGFKGFDEESTMSDIQKEALRKIGSAEKAQRNSKMIGNMLKNLQNSYQRILGDSVGSLNHETINELGASVAAQGNIETDKTLGTFDAIINDLMRIKEAMKSSVSKIQSDASIPMMFSKLRELILLKGPSLAQIKAGNYKKKKVKFNGFDISIENKKGSYRKGIDQNGKEWKVLMPYDYGYIKGTKGNDGDHVDCFLGPNKNSLLVYIMNVFYDNKFDEHKVMLGFDSEEEAKNGFWKAYGDGYKGKIDSITELTINQFKSWLDEESQKKPSEELVFT